MAASKNIIDDTVSTPRSRELVRLIIPILIRWAKSGKTDSTYGDLIHALGMVRYSGIGRQLGDVQNVIDALQSMSNVRIPTLNSLVKSGTTQLPSDGFDFVSKKYSSLDTAGKKVFVEGLDSNAVKFRRWDWVLDQLGLEPAKIITEEELQIKIKKMGGHGGEGEEHKNLKKFIYNLIHPVLELPRTPFEEQKQSQSASYVSYLPSVFQAVYVYEKYRHRNILLSHLCEQP